MSHPDGPFSPRREPRAALAVLLAAAVVIPHARAAGDERAGRVAERVLAFSGGVSTKLKYVRFVFTSEENGKVGISRTHYWDVRGRRHRIEMTGEEGEPVVCLTYLDDKMGVCSVGGEALLGDAAGPHLDRAYAAWTNDSHWLLMPYKMTDPGVGLEYAGEQEERGAVYDKVHVTFGSGDGPVPDEESWVYVDRKSGRPDRSECVSRAEDGEKEAGDPIVWEWTGWERRGGMMFSTERGTPDGKRKIRFNDLEVYESLPEIVFAGTSPVDLSKLSPSEHR